jgi:hypothetical protein
MSLSWLRACALLAASLLASCAPTPPASVADDGMRAVAVQPNWLHRDELGRSCRATADGRPIEVAERGVGGTGPAELPASKPRPGKSDPTGIAAIITGFGSVCLAGLEVGLAPDLAVSVDGAAAAETSLRAGQRVALTAGWEDGRPVTRAIAVRHELVGPIDALGADGYLTVAGQPVRLVSGDWREARLIPGAWVAVSGLHAPDGVILASRIDPAPMGEVLLHGRLSRGPGGWRMGQLAIDLPRDADAPAGAVVLQGRLRDGRLQAAFWRPDTLETNPAGYFGPSVHRYAIQALVAAHGQALTSYDFQVSLPRNIALPNAVVPAVIGFERVGIAGMAATSVSPEGVGGAATDAGSYAGPGTGTPMRGADGGTNGPGSSPGPGPGAGAGLGRR